MNVVSIIFFVIWRCCSVVFELYRHISPLTLCVCVCVCVCVCIQRWCLWLTAATGTDWWRLTVNWPNYWRRRSWETPCCSSLQTNRYKQNNNGTPENHLERPHLSSHRGDNLFAGCSRCRVCGGDDGAAESTQAVLWEELAHSGLRRPQRDGSPRGAGLALQTAGGCWRPGCRLDVASLYIPVLVWLSLHHHFQTLTFTMRLRL